MKNMSKTPKSGKMPSKPPKMAPPPMAKKPTDVAKRPAEKAGIMFPNKLSKKKI